MRAGAGGGYLRRWWRRGSLTTKTVLVLVVALGPVAASLTFLGVLNERDADLDRDIVVHRDIRLAETEVLKTVVDADTAVRGFLLTRDEIFLAPYRAAREALPTLLKRLEAPRPVDHEDLAGPRPEEVRQVVRPQMAILARALASPYSLARLRQEKAGMDAFRRAMAAHIEHQDAVIAALMREREKTDALARTVLVGGGLVSVLAALLGAFALMRGIVIRIRRVTENAVRLTQGEELSLLGEMPDGDEIAQLAGRLKESAHMLRARESDLRLAKAEADAANAAKSEFLSRMSHELRTPLNAILGFAEVARSEVQGEAGRDLDQIRLGGRHLLALINEVLDIAKIEAGELSLSLEPVDVREIVAEAIALVSGAAESRSIRVRVEQGDGMYARADRQRLKQVLVNLLSNAVKYNRVEGEVRVASVAQDEQVRVSVADTGPGLPGASVDEAFKPFTRLGAETTEIEGTGLGLAVTKSLVEAMGGHVDVASTGPEGTEFCVYLEAAVSPESVTSLVAAPAPVTEISTRRLRGRVLQVEDNPSNIRLMSRIMQRRPEVDLVTAQYGEEAVMLATELQPDLVLLDLNLPDMSGRDVLGRLRADPQTSHLRVVMLSADATESQVQDLLRLGAHDYLTKPIDVSALLKSIDDALALKETG